MKTATATRELTGVVSRILWCADDKSIVIAKLQTGEIVKGQIDGDGLSLNTTYRFLGLWETHVKHGEQFAFTTFVKAVPASPEGVIKYLVDECPNVGRAKAARLWEEFGSEAVATVRTDPATVAASGILNYEQAAEASEALEKVAALEQTRIDLFGVLHGRGFPGSTLKAVIHKWGARSADTIRRNPFSLLIAKIPGAGFKRCDKLYIDNKHPPAKLKRQMLCLWNAIRTNSDGHTWHKAADAVREMGDIPQTQLRGVDAARLGVRAKWLAKWRDADGVLWLAESEKATQEWRLSEAVATLLGSEAVVWPSGNFIGLSEHQVNAVRRILTKPFAILAGTPGTGKTYTAAVIVREITKTHGLSSIAVVAPTGKAAVRVQAAMSSYGLAIQATTIHRLLGIQRNGHDGGGWDFQFNRANPLPHKFVIVDESSMIDTGLAADLLEACAAGTHILWIGDPYQLPPVGHGAPLRDLIAAGIPSAELTEIRRNAGMIVEACAKIKNGQAFAVTVKYDPEAGHNLRMVETETSERSIETMLAILKQFRASDKFDPVWETQVIVAVNRNSKLSRKLINDALQMELNPDGLRVERNPFRVGDKVICLKNGIYAKVFSPESIPLHSTQPTDATAYATISDEGEPQASEYIANGDIGRVLAIAPQLMIVRFTCPDRTIKIPMGKQTKSAEDGEEAGNASEQEESGRGCNFDLAYAVTCHKCQGSESGCVIVMVDDYSGAKRICTREWIYTAISRAKKLCVLIGKKQTAYGFCKRVALTKRKTFLRELLSGITEGNQ